MLRLAEVVIALEGGSSVPMIRLVVLEPTGEVDRRSRCFP
jgi:hypothetical protein